MILKDYLVIRFKSKNSDISDLINHRDYLEFEISDEITKKIQFSIISESDLMICYQGGVHSMNQIVKTSFLQINSIPINISGVIKKDDR